MMGEIIDGSKNQDAQYSFISEAYAEGFWHNFQCDCCFKIGQKIQHDKILI